EDAVVRAAGLLAVDGDVDARGGAALEQFVEQAARRHAVADDGEALLRWRRHQAAASAERARARTAHTLNSGMRLVGSSAGIVRMLAARLPPQWNGANSVSGRISGDSSISKATLPRRLSTSRR